MGNVQMTHSTRSPLVGGFLAGLAACVGAFQGLRGGARVRLAACSGWQEKGEGNQRDILLWFRDTKRYQTKLKLALVQK
jgi:hypothetical protein